MLTCVCDRAPSSLSSDVLGVEGKGMYALRLLRLSCVVEVAKGRAGREGKGNRRSKTEVSPLNLFDHIDRNSVYTCIK